MDRDDRIVWARNRALDCLNNGDLALAIASMTTDLGKYPETRMSPTTARLVVNSIEMPLTKEKVEIFIKRFK